MRSTRTVKNLEKLNPLDEVSTSLSHNVYRWKAYYLSDMTGSLVNQSVATAKAHYVAKVGLFVLLAIFLVGPEECCIMIWAINA